MLLHVPSAGFYLLLSCFGLPLPFQFMGVILYWCPTPSQTEKPGKEEELLGLLEHA